MSMTCQQAKTDAKRTAPANPQQVPAIAGRLAIPTQYFQSVAIHQVGRLEALSR